MKKIILGTITISLLLVLNISECYSEIEAPSVEAGLSVGYLFIDDDIGDDDQAFARLDLGFNITKRFGVELSLLNTLDSFDKVPDATFYTLSTIMHLSTESDFNSYISLGVGAGNFNTDVKDNESEFVVTGGLGIKYFMDNKFALKFDVRDYMVPEDSAHNFSASVGVMIMVDILAPEAVGVPSLLTEEPEEPEVVYEEPGEAEVEDAAKEEPAEEVKEEALEGEKKDAVVIDSGAPVEAVAPVIPAEVAVPEEIVGPEEAPAIEDTAKEVPVEAVAPVVPVIVEKPEETVEPEGAPTIPEEIPAGQIIVIHKGAQLLVHFPEKSDTLDSETFNLLLQLIYFVSEKDVKDVKIVCYSFDYASEQLNRSISEERSSAIREFVLENSDFTGQNVKVEEQDQGALEKFRGTVGKRPENINRAYILITFK